MEIDLHYADKNHPDLPLIKNCFKKAGILFKYGRNDEGLKRILKLGEEIENKLFALHLARKHFLGLDMNEATHVLAKKYQELIQKTEDQK